MEILSAELLAEILGYCDSFDNYRTWCLVCKEWYQLSKIYCPRNILRCVLKSEMERMNILPSLSTVFECRSLADLTKSMEFILNLDASINSLSFMCWGPTMSFKSVHIEGWPGWMNKNLMDDFTVNHPYNFGSSMPSCSSFGYLNLAYMRRGPSLAIYPRIRMVFQCERETFTPFTLVLGVGPLEMKPILERLLDERCAVKALMKVEKDIKET